MNASRRVLMDIYHRLLARFGRQGWWPAGTPFEVMVGAVLTQNTNWKNVERAVSNLARAGILSPERILERPDLASLLRPAGYYNVKSRRLMALCRKVIDLGGVEGMRNIPTDDLREELLSVHGIGDETADSILLYALDRAVFVVDAYTRRVLGRMGLIKGNEGYAHIQAGFMRALPSDVDLYGEYHALLVALGKGVCRKRRSGCRECPLCLSCVHARDALSAGTSHRSTGMP